MTNLTPIQLEEFESVFRHFDRHLRNALSEIEFSAALASLGLVYDEHEMHAVFDRTSGGGGGGGRGAGAGGGAGGGGGGRDTVSFEQFIKFMVEVTEDQNTAEQVFQSFREVADGKVCPLSQVYSTIRPVFTIIQHRPFFFLLFGDLVFWPLDLLVTLAFLVSWSLGLLISLISCSLSLFAQIFQSPKSHPEANELGGNHPEDFDSPTSRNWIFDTRSFQKRSSSSSNSLYPSYHLPHQHTNTTTTTMPLLVLLLRRRRRRTVHVLPTPAMIMILLLQLQRRTKTRMVMRRRMMRGICQGMTMWLLWMLSLVVVMAVTVRSAEG